MSINLIILIIGQGMIAFLPAMLVMACARASPHAAADLSITFALVGALFSLSYFGQRGYIAVRGFSAVPWTRAIALRLAMTTLALGASLWCGEGLALPITAILTAAGTKLSESIIDLWNGMRLFISSTRTAALHLAAIATARAAAIGAICLWYGMIGMAESPYPFFPLAALAVAILAGLILDIRRFPGIQTSRPIPVGRSLGEMSGFFIATATCSILVSAPRILLADGEQHVPEALALSLAPIIALFGSSWWLVTMPQVRDLPRSGLLRLWSGLAALAAIAGILHPAWKAMASALYGLSAQHETSAFADIIAASGCFFAVIAAANIFKAHAHVAHESATYATGAVALGLGYLWWRTPMAVAMLASSAAMLIYQASMLTSYHLTHSRKNLAQEIGK